MNMLKNKESLFYTIGFTIFTANFSISFINLLNFVAVYDANLMLFSLMNVVFNLVMMNIFLGKIFGFK